MKKNLKLFIVSLLLISLLLSATSCIYTGQNGSASVNDDIAKIVTVSNETVSDSYVNHPVDELPEEQYTQKTSFRDDNNYYYVFYLGYVENVPMQDNYPSFKYSGNDYKKVMTATKTTENAVEDSIDKVSSTNSGWQKKDAFKKAVEKDGAKFNWVLNFDFEDSSAFESGFEEAWSTSNVNSVSEMATKATTHSEQIADTVEFQFDKSCAHGYYRYVLMGAYDVYAVITYNPVKKEYGTATYSYLFNLSYTLDFSTDPHFNDSSITEISYDTSNFVIDVSKKPEKYYPTVNDDTVKDEINPDTPNMNEENSIENNNNNNTSSGTTPPISTKLEVIKIPVNRKLCLTDKEYKIDSNPSKNKDIEKHNDFEIGHLEIYGCEKKSNGSYVIKDKKAFAIQYIFDQNPAKLPCDNEYYVSNETEKYVFGADIQNNEIGKGAYCINIKYEGGSSGKPIIVTNFMANKTTGSISNLINNVNSYNLDLDRIVEIKIVMVYELNFYAGWFNQHHTDWRCDYTFTFDN